VILCDLMMPIMTGMELHDQLAKTDPGTAAEIIFMTGGAFSPGALDFLEHMPNQLVEKPFDLRELRAIIAGRI
jgi:CheY-like chemotaxis protein